MATADYELVTKGILDAQNRQSIRSAEPLVPGQSYDFDFPLLPEDYVFQAGHRIGVIIVGSYPQYSSQADQNRANISSTCEEQHRAAHGRRHRPPSRRVSRDSDHGGAGLRTGSAA